MLLRRFCVAPLLLLLLLLLAVVVPLLLVPFAAAGCCAGSSDGISIEMGSSGRPKGTADSRGLFRDILPEPFVGGGVCCSCSSCIGNAVDASFAAYLPLSC